MITLSTREIRNRTPITSTKQEVPNTANGKGLLAEIEKLEEITFGQKQTGSMIERLQRLEAKVKKPTSTITPAERVKALSEALSGAVKVTGTGSDDKSLEGILKQVETELGLKPDPSDEFYKRIKAAEKALRGIEASGGLYKRAKDLYEEIFG